MVGASATTNRPSYFAMKYLLGKGYRVIPVNPGLAGKEILGQRVYALARRGAGAGRHRRHLPQFGRRARGHARGHRRKDKLGIKVIWMQLGVRNEKAAAEAEAAGLKVVMNRCPKIEYGRLSGEIGWAGVNAGAISSKRPLLGPRGVQNHVIAGKR